MYALSILIHFLSTILVICTGFSKADTKFQHFNVYAGQRFKAELDHFEGEAINLMQCAAMCNLDENCTSASFHDVVGTCRLSEFHVDEPNGGQEMIVDTAWSALSTKVDPRFNGWIPVGKSWYLIQLVGTNLDDAKQFCEQHGGRLAEPQDAIMHRLLSKFLLRNFDHSDFYWIGLKSDYGNNTFVWESDGQEPTYTMWHNANEHHIWGCLALSLSSDDNEFRWDDHFCRDEYRAVCQASWLD